MAGRASLPTTLLLGVNTISLAITRFAIPSSHRFQRQPDPFKWSADDAVDKSFEQVFVGEADSFGISFGLTVPLRFWHGRYAAVTFASDMRSANSRANIRKSCMSLEAIATTFHLQVCATFQALHSVGIGSLEPREVRCLTWAAHGKVYEEIGEILEISARTMKAHIDNAKRKLGVLSLREAIRLLVASQI